MCTLQLPEAVPIAQAAGGSKTPPFPVAALCCVHTQNTPKTVLTTQGVLCLLAVPPAASHSPMENGAFAVWSLLSFVCIR